MASTGRSLSGYLEQLLTPNSSRRRVRASSPQFRRSSSMADNMHDAGNDENDPPRWREGSPTPNSRRNLTDDQWRKIVSHIAADYAKLGAAHKSLKAQFDEQRAHALALAVGDIATPADGTAPPEVTPRLQPLPGDILAAPVGAEEGVCCHRPDVSAESLAVNMAAVEIETQAKEFFMARAFELQRDAQGVLQHAEGLEAMTEDLRREIREGKEAAQDQCRRLKQQLAAAELAAQQQMLECQKLRGALEQRTRDQKEMQELFESARRDQEAYRQQLEKIVRERQLLHMKTDDLSTRAAQMKRKYEEALLQLEQAQRQAEDERDNANGLQRELGVAQESIRTLEATLQTLKFQQQGNQTQLKAQEIRANDLQERVQQTECEMEVLVEDKERLLNMLRLTVEAFQYHGHIVFNLEGMRDLADNLEMELQEQQQSEHRVSPRA